MSLDVYLTVSKPIPKKRGSGIFVRREGRTQEISREEWDAAHPGIEPFVATITEETTTSVYEANITHNLGVMAKAAGIYQHLWRPEEIGVEVAADLIEPLTLGLRKMQAEPVLYQALNPTNGWGNYDGLVSFVEAYLQACIQYPEATVSVSR